MTKPNDRQLSLLADLYELQKMGLVSGGETVSVQDGYDAGSLEGDVGPTVTHEGQKAVEEFYRSGRTICL